MPIEPMVVNTKAECVADLIAPPAMIRKLINRCSEELSLLTDLLALSEKAIEQKQKTPKNRKGTR